MTLEQKQQLKKNNCGALRTSYAARWMLINYAITFSDSLFAKYLSEKQHQYANKLLQTEVVKDYCDVTDEEDIEAIHEESLLKLGYFLRPKKLFFTSTAKGNASLEEESNFILDDLNSILNNIEQSTMGTESEDDFNKLFEDLDLASRKLGRSPIARNSLIASVISYLDKIDFGLEGIQFRCTGRCL